MTKTNAANERIKREYFRYLKEAHGRDEATIDGVARSLARFEQSTGGKDFKRFHREQAVAFKAKLANAKNADSGMGLAKATLLSTMRDLRAFYVWLSRERGFRSHIAYADADYFNLSDKDVAVARTSRNSGAYNQSGAQRLGEAAGGNRDRAARPCACRFRDDYGRAARRAGFLQADQRQYRRRIR